LAFDPDFLAETIYLTALPAADEENSARGRAGLSTRTAAPARGAQARRRRPSIGLVIRALSHFVCIVVEQSSSVGAKACGGLPASSLLSVIGMTGQGAPIQKRRCVARPIQKIRNVRVGN
jgi:hypothetical protein